MRNSECGIEGPASITERSSFQLRILQSAFRIRLAAIFRRSARRTDPVRQRADRYLASMDDRRAALLLSILALAGAGVRYVLAPRAAAPGDVQLRAAVDTPPHGSGSGLQQAAGTAARLARPLGPGDHVDLDRADVTEITRLPRVGPSLAQRIVAWRTEHGTFGSLDRLDSVPGVGPKLIETLRPFIIFSGAAPSPP